VERIGSARYSRSPYRRRQTLVALVAIDELKTGACIVAPTRALVAQWFTQLADAFGVERVGAYYGDEKEVRALTVTTYHSAFALLERWGARFGLLVLDEAHHLADTAEGEARAWHDLLRIAPCPFRLGLTATYPDGRDAELRRLVGPIAYRRTIGEMTDAELARFARFTSGSGSLGWPTASFVTPSEFSVRIQPSRRWCSVAELTPPRRYRASSRSR
jgi:superfamily II DNA or RNA helicase